MKDIPFELKFETYENILNNTLQLNLYSLRMVVPALNKISFYEEFNIFITYNFEKQTPFIAHTFKSAIICQNTQMNSQTYNVLPYYFWDNDFPIKSSNIQNESTYVL